MSSYNDVKSASLFTIGQAGGSSTEAQIYANGLHQVPVIISMILLDANHNRLTNVPNDQILPHLQLIDYYTGDSVSRSTGNGWFYTDSMNQFCNTIGQNVSMAAADLPEATMQPPSDNIPTNVITLYIQTTALNDKSFAAKLTLADGSVLTTQRGSNADSKVHISPLARVSFDASNTQLTQYNTATIQNSNGTTYDQDNYYFKLTASGHVLHVVETDPGSFSNSNWYFNIIWDGDDTPAWGYIWKMSNTEESRTDTPQYSMSNGTKQNLPTVTFQVNEYRDALCLTRLLYRPAHLSSGSNYHTWWGNTNFTAYDQYGNSGRFHAYEGGKSNHDKGNTICIDIGFGPGNP